MDEVDDEDLNELEARLYAQIHHEPSGDTEISENIVESPAVRQVTANSVINNKPIDRTRVGRYWNDKGGFRTPAKFDTPPAGEIKQSPGEKPSVAHQGNGNVKTQQPPAETGDKLFRPPVKSLSKMRVNPFASGNGPKSKGSSSLNREKNPFSKSEKNQRPHKGTFARQMTKFDHALKYEAKKQKAKAAKAKAPKVVDRIELLSSDESETDDVIEVPLPSPKILTIDSSSDEENPTKCQGDFVKPQASPAEKKDSSSRCTSPCSVVSDDFIGQNDRSRLLEEDGRADDEDLLMLQEDVDSLMENPEKSTDKTPESSFVAPAKASASTDYRVTPGDFRALDVYESESDIQESVYQKGTRPSVVVQLEHESSSGDDVQEIAAPPKTKRLRKRATSSNKDSETYVDSTDSEQELDPDYECTPKARDGVVRSRIPFIAHGTAVEDFVSTGEPMQPGITNTSDNEFLSRLNTLAQGTAAGHENGSDDAEEEHITARAIAESVIRKENGSVKPVECVIPQDENANDAIPKKTLEELNGVFEKIDELTKEKKVVDFSDDSDTSVQLVAPIPVEKYGRVVANKKENYTGDPIYNIVYSEGETHMGGIGWNEEMRKFYNNSWNGEHFSVHAICSRMEKNKSLWKIYTEDRFPKYRRNSHQKCMNCCEFGHIKARCPKPRKPLICYMCGERGHQEPRCPNTVCLRCGNKTRMFTKSCNACNYQNRLTCPVCKMRGHTLNLCPDKWRRYHSTTKPNEYPNNKVEYKSRKFCCICGCRGHLAEHCRNAVRFSEYPLFSTDIQSHQKSYADLAVNTIRSGIGFNLMYKPNEDLSFELAENKSSKHYYGRFLIAVGLGHLLTRKRKKTASIAEEEPVNKQTKVSTALKEYVINPFAKAALEKSSPKPTTTTRQAQPQPQHNDVDKATEADKLPSTPTARRNSGEEPMATDDVQPEPRSSASFIADAASADTGPKAQCTSITSTFKTPDTAPTSTQTQRQTPNEADFLEVIDSDSNYSFSEHFEPPQVEEAHASAREMAPLPDFIPINDDDDSVDELSSGISKRFVSADTDDDESCNLGSLSLPDIPCEAKIYLTNFHSKFLLGPEGNKFLVDKSTQFGVRATLDWTSVGHILVIYGQRVNQDRFHKELLHKFRDLSDRMNRKQLENSQKLPKKAEVLIRFLREHINQLLSNIGNVNDLHKRLYYQENQHTKSGWKSAEKTRRMLNMILIGQAGLRNGSKHLDNLLSHLRNLIDDNDDDAVVPIEVRDEIDSHWKLIFSSYRHDKYDELVTAYNHMQVKNRLQNLNIDPRLLGKKLLDTTLTKAQKEKLNKWADTDAAKDAEKLVPAPPKLVLNPASAKFQARQPKTPNAEKKRTKNTPTNTPSASQVAPHKQQPPPEEATNSPLANKINAVNTEWETKCVNLLTEIDSKEKIKKGSPVRDSKASSVFWSREAMKYIDECMQVGKSNPSLMEKLTRVQQKSHKGLLSYNDYRAIIKIHVAIKGKQ